MTETENIPMNKLGERTTLLVTEKSLLDLIWWELKTEHINIVCTAVQPAEFVTELSTSSSPLGKVFDIEDADKSSDSVGSGLYIEDQVDGKIINSWIKKSVQFVTVTVILVQE